MWVDSDFAGLWDKDMAMQQPVTAKSRIGFVVTFINCTVIWASQIQSEIALSTFEPEYWALNSSYAISWRNEGQIVVTVEHNTNSVLQCFLQ